MRLFLQAIWKCHEISAESYSLFTWRTRNAITRRCYKSAFVAAPPVMCTSIWRHAMLRFARRSWNLTFFLSFIDVYSPYFWVLIVSVKGHALAHFVVALRYKPEGRGFDSLWLELFGPLWLWCQFSLQQQWVPGIFCGSKDGRRLGLTTLPL